MFWLWRHGPEGLIHPLAFVPGVRHEPSSGPQRCKEFTMARAAPSGTRGDTCGDEPRTRWALVPVECQEYEADSTAALPTSATCYTVFIGATRRNPCVFYIWENRA